MNRGTFKGQIDEAAYGMIISIQPDWAQGNILQILYELIIQIFVNVIDVVMWRIMIQSGHNFAHATAAVVPWHVQNCNQIKLLESKLKQK